MFKFCALLICHGAYMLLHCSGAMSDTSYVYETKYFKDMPVDHFGFSNKDTFALRYLINNTWWDKEHSGPIFLYAGNEGGIETFAQNTGLMWDIADEYKALLLFIEHRYYGDSYPYGNKSFDDPKYSNFLTSEQALADFAQGVTTIKQEFNVPKSKVIVFGGSYGGMLAAWLRLKYPNIVDGAIAASAPVAWFENLTECSAYTVSVTSSFTRESPQCSNNVNSSWDVITNTGSTAEGRVALQKQMNLCDPLTSDDDVASLRGWISDTWGNLAMVNYPYPTNFLAPLPAWPIKEVCKSLSAKNPSNDEIIAGITAGLGVYYNYTGQTPCFNVSAGADAALDAKGWSYQVCTEMVMPMCSGGPGDMFEESKWNLTSYIQNCEEKYGVTVRPNWAVIQYGGRDLSGASNIVLSNGDLDPWGPGGIHTNISDTVIAVSIADGAHHLDLRSANSADPPSVIAARQLEKMMITKWLGEGKVEATKNQLLETQQPQEDSDNSMLVVATGTNVVKIVLITCIVLVFGLLLVAFVCFVSRATRPRLSSRGAREYDNEEIQAQQAGRYMPLVNNDKMVTA